MGIIQQVFELTNLAKDAKQQLIDGQRCFVLEREKYYRAVEILNDWIEEQGFDPRLAAEGWENRSVALSSADERRYFFVTKAVPTLDEIWKEK